MTAGTFRGSPRSVKGLERLGRTRLSPSFFMRDFLYSEIAAMHGFGNVPDDPNTAIEAGRGLCTHLLEPLQASFGRISIRSAYRSAEVNAFGNEHGMNCASNARNCGGHIWDQRDDRGCLGATACIIVNAFIDYYERSGHWEALAWWVHDHLPYSRLEFYPQFAAFNITWSEQPERVISSRTPPRRGLLTKPGMSNFDGSHESEYQAWLSAAAGPGS